MTGSTIRAAPLPRVVGVDPGERAGVAFLSAAGLSIGGHVVNGADAAEVAGALRLVTFPNRTVLAIEKPIIRTFGKPCPTCGQARRSVSRASIATLIERYAYWVAAARILGMEVHRVEPHVWQKAMGAVRPEVRFALARSVGLETDSIDVATACCVGMYVQREIGRVRTLSHHASETGR